MIRLENPGSQRSIVFQHYRGLATKAEAENWFAVMPAEAAQNVVPYHERSQRVSFPA